MAHYEERLEKDLASLREHIAEVGAKVDRALADAAQSLLKHDLGLASATILGDHPINRATNEVEKLCYAFIARHFPSAGNLRFVSSVLRLMVALERIGDYAVSISREAVRLSPEAVHAVVEDVETMASQSRQVLAKAMEAFLTGNAELARGTMSMANLTRSVFHNVYNHLIAEGRRGSRSVEDLFGLLIVMYRLERISDQAKNICEETVFAVTGEVKPPKVFHILFVDERNDCESLMAEEIARRMFSDSGTYDSAGWRPAERLGERFVAFMARSGYDVARRAPRKLQAKYEDLKHTHVIVSLESDAYIQVPELPFRTVLVEWPGARRARGTEEPGDEMLEATYKDLVAKIFDLMETLRGKVTS